jgi:hypothetical protein
MDRLILAADAASRALSEDDAVQFLGSSTSEPKRREALAALRSAVNQAVQALSTEGGPPAAERLPKGSLGWQKGWRLIARARIEAGREAGADAVLAAAGDCVLLAARIADLSAADQTLAWTILREALEAVQGAWSTASADSAARLADRAFASADLVQGIEALSRVEQAGIEHEIRRIEVYARARRASELTADYGLFPASALAYLDRSGPEERSRVLEGFRREAEAYARWAEAAALKPPAEAGDYKDARPSEEDRSWWRLGEALVRPLLEAPDLRRRLSCRIRLLAVAAEVESIRKAQGQAPKALSSRAAKAVDPYTGVPFHYLSQDRDYQLFSLGKDGENNAGATDAAGESPDFVLFPAKS